MRFSDESMASAVLVINGPNLNLLGLREPAVYGRETLADLEAACRAEGDGLGLAVDCRQSNHEGALVDWIHEARETTAAILINAGAYSHTSQAIPDALRAYPGMIVELHLSNIYAREPFRHHSHISATATAVICGLGSAGYRLALRAVAERLAAEKTV
jgi:3-dehydroquinate dehydratase II